MSDDEVRQGATSGDESQSFATSRDGDYTLSIEDALARYEAAGTAFTGELSAWMGGAVRSSTVTALPIATLSGSKFWPSLEIPDQQGIYRE